MPREITVTELEDNLKLKESQLARVKSEWEILRHQCNSIREVIRIVTNPEDQTSKGNYSTSVDGHTENK